MFVTPEFPSENPRIQNRNYPYTKTLCFILPAAYFSTFGFCQHASSNARKTKRAKISQRSN
jgi:hypothetical protein